MIRAEDYPNVLQPFKPDFEGLLADIRREGTPKRVFNMELFLDGEMQQAMDEIFGISKDLDRSDPDFDKRFNIAWRRFLGYDYVSVAVEGVEMPIKHNWADDTTEELSRKQGRAWVDEGRGLITNWEEFEKYPWPDYSKIRTDTIEWYLKNLPDDMGIAAHMSHYCEYICWLMGYESACYALYDQRDLVQAIYDKIMERERASIETFLQFDRIRIIWASDDMGYKTGTMFAPTDMKEFVLSGHKAMAKIAHDAGRLYLLHACGDRSKIMEDLIEDVKLDAIHSFEDVIEPVIDAKKKWGDRLAILGGIDVDFLCRATPEEIRKRTRETLDACLPGGGYALGSGNSVANYIPPRNYLAMLDEGRGYA